jgi:phosphatidylserine/phosphatidylglycerophosphate/cardiolipin synthase-like enzyme
VRAILAQYDGEKNDSQNDYGKCIQIRFLKKPLHAKAILRDKDKAFIGSFNFTKNSLENNRELGIFIS